MLNILDPLLRPQLQKSPIKSMIWWGCSRGKGQIILRHHLIIDGCPRDDCRSCWQLTKNDIVWCYPWNVYNWLNIKVKHSHVHIKHSYCTAWKSSCKENNHDSHRKNTFHYWLAPSSAVVLAKLIKIGFQLVRLPTYARFCFSNDYLFPI